MEIQEILSTVKETKYAVQDVDGNEVLCESKELGNALEKAVKRANKAYNYIISKTNEKYFGSKGIKVGDAIKVITYWPSNLTYEEGAPIIGIYGGLVIDRFDPVTGNPIFKVKLHNQWNTGLKSVSHSYPYHDIPSIEFNSTCDFSPVKDDIHCFQDVFSVSSIEKERYADAILESTK